MYIYHALINALRAHMIHINLNMIFYTHIEHCAAFLVLLSVSCLVFLGQLQSFLVLSSPVVSCVVFHCFVLPYLIVNRPDLTALVDWV